MPPIRPPEQRVASTLARLAPGTLGGTLKSAARPVTPVGTVRTASAGGSGGGLPSFNFRGALLTAVSDPIPSPGSFTVGSIAAALRIAGTTSTTVSIEVNGVSIGSVTIPADDTFAESAVTSAFVVENDLLQARVTSAGTDAFGLGVIPKAA